MGIVRRLWSWLKLGRSTQERLPAASFGLRESEVYHCFMPRRAAALEAQMRAV